MAVGRKAKTGFRDGLIEHGEHRQLQNPQNWHFLERVRAVCRTGDAICCLRVHGKRPLPYRLWSGWDACLLHRHLATDCRGGSVASHHTQA